MIPITVLLVFLAGYAFGVWGAQLLDNIFNTITIWFQEIQGKMAVKITEDSVKASKLKKELDDFGSSTHAIGFMTSNEIEDDEEEYEEDLDI